MKNIFNRFSGYAVRMVGSTTFFIIAFLSVVLWLVSGPLFHYSTTWQLIINTVTTIITFLVAILIQHSQNRDTHILQLKLDEIIKAIKSAHNEIINLDQLSDEQLISIEQKYRQLGKKPK